MTVILLRHGRSTANTSGVLAGRTPGIGLDEKGAAQAAALTERLAAVTGDVRAVVRSPLQRCAETVAPLVGALGEVPELVDDRFVEVDYGDWSNRPLKELLAEPLWKTVQTHPSAAVFPGGEGLSAVSQRATAAVRELDRRHGGEDGHGLWVLCSHGDVLKAILADALGMHLDAFQRIVVDPASISVIHYAAARPYVHTVNNNGVLTPLPRPAQAAAVGGSTGT
ncbi:MULTISPECIES: MSMEG_4193 family putative phosphomutase [unclassified Gordonia (in: high G+C Gram-positive bacteria)]|uniref:MSMEG_4193 family putative phosphomutase n=1 Tax=unclassified Gordonia (in: high G+C Gram-positive bacteria) TaxID=2657482 RepID=UPI001FFF8BC5|nr:MULTISPECIES: MSMEG_4193 family putative phosphomutase [unclassified Gordonia (in: high G+C Gram-positive bacteria)]UQE76730.1 MSMEG_4193 family putative phosphomutase [Gordonia sp. PP30]